MRFVFPILFAMFLQTIYRAVDLIIIGQFCGAGVLFIVAYNLLGAIFRGLGNSKVPLIIVAIACVLTFLVICFLLQS